jgi:tetratricopeptide (TPR) repeat protein
MWRALALVVCAGVCCHAEDAQTLNRHGAELEGQGRFAGAVSAFDNAASACRQTGCSFLGAILSNLGSVYHAMARYPEAEAVLRQAIEASAADGQDPASLPTALVNLAAVYRAQARYADALPLYERALKLREADPATAARDVPRVLTHIAALAQDTGDYERAEETIRKAIAGFEASGGMQSSDGLAALISFGAILSAEGKFAEAERADRRALALYRNGLQGAAFAESYYVTVLNGLANILVAEKRPKEAEPLFREALALSEKLLGPNHPSVASCLMNLGALLQAQHRYQEAEALMDRAVRIDAGNLPPDHPHIAIDLNDQAALLVARKRYRDAEQLLLRADSILEQRHMSAGPDLGRVLANLGEVYRLEKRLPESRESFARGLKLLTAAWGQFDPRLLAWLTSYVSVLRASEDYAEAEKLDIQATRIRVDEARRRAG